MKPKLNAYLRAGLLSIAAAGLMRSFDLDWEFVQGFLCGLGLTLTLFGVVTRHRARSEP